VAVQVGWANSGNPNINSGSTTRSICSQYISQHCYRERMMLDWNEYQKQLSTTIAEIARTSPDIARGYRMLSDAAAKTGKIDAKTRELISLAVAVTLRCDGSGSPSA
jgi:hypothetical protein